MLPTIALDMDGTVSNLYGVRGWLDSLKGYDAAPYYNADTIGDCNYLNDLIELGTFHTTTTQPHKPLKCFGCARTCPLLMMCGLCDMVPLSILSCETLEQAFCSMTRSLTETLSGGPEDKHACHRIFQDFSLHS